MKDGFGAGKGASLGLLFGIFRQSLGPSQYGTIPISRNLALEMAFSEPIEWTGIVIGLRYKPRSTGRAATS
jgi:hypothetical protein